MNLFSVLLFVLRATYLRSGILTSRRDWRGEAHRTLPEQTPPLSFSLHQHELLARELAALPTFLRLCFPLPFSFFLFSLNASAEEVKLSLCLTKQYAMKTHGGVDV
jgi:hypothetical protein